MGKYDGIYSRFDIYFDDNLYWEEHIKRNSYELLEVNHS